MKRKKPAPPTCYLCRGRANEEHYCYGCRAYVCEECDKTFCIGEHAPGDHLRVTYGEFHGTPIARLAR